jgi:hypothetical protein
MRSEYGTHSLRRTKASIIYWATGNLRAVQILLGHSKIENTVRYLGIDVEDALALAENTERRVLPELTLKLAHGNGCIWSLGDSRNKRSDRTDYGDDRAYQGVPRNNEG